MKVCPRFQIQGNMSILLKLFCKNLICTGFTFSWQIWTLRKHKCNFNKTHLYFRQGFARAYRNESKPSGKRIHALIVNTTEKQCITNEKKLSHFLVHCDVVCLLPQPFSVDLPLWSLLFAVGLDVVAFPHSWITVVLNLSLCLVMLTSFSFYKGFSY